MQNLTCIVCPLGCSLTVSGEAEDLQVTGNRCPRGAVYAREEIRAPKRQLTATCALAEPPRNGPRRAPVKSSIPCPREQIPALLEDIYKLRLSLPIHAGDVVIAGWRDSGIDVIALRDLE
jgi:CxxC motif-containing protein